MNAKTKSELSKALCGAALGLAALNLPAEAAEGRPISKTVFERPIGFDVDLDARFNVDRELGRAWVEVEVTPRPEGDEAPDTSIIKEAVRGLYYDRESKQVIYQKGQTRFVCAADSTFLWSTSLKDTGACVLRATERNGKVDDGFDPEDVVIGKVVLEVPPSANTAVSSSN